MTTLENVSRLLVDGANVVGARPDGWWRDRRGAAERLSARLAAYARSTGTEVTVVFDRPGPRRVPRDVTVVVAAREGRDAADDDIAALVGRDRDPGTLRVVTADRRLRERVTRAGASVSGPRALLAALDEVAVDLDDAGDVGGQGRE